MQKRLKNTALEERSLRNMAVAWTAVSVINIPQYHSLSRTFKKRVHDVQFEGISFFSPSQLTCFELMLV